MEVWSSSTSGRLIVIMIMACDNKLFRRMNNACTGIPHGARRCKWFCWIVIFTFNIDQNHWSRLSRFVANIPVSNGTFIQPGNNHHFMIYCWSNRISSPKICIQTNAGKQKQGPGSHWKGTYWRGNLVGLDMTCCRLMHRGSFTVHILPTRNVETNKYELDVDLA